MKLLYTLILSLSCGTVFAQVGIGTTTPNPNAVLELKSPGNNQGFLVPRLTTVQRTAITLAAADNGLMVYDTNDQKFYYWQDTQWLPIRSGSDVELAAGTGINISGNTISAADADATNEIQDLQLSGNSLQITNNASATAIDLSPFIDADGDATNEIQDLQLNGNTLSITNNPSATAIDLAPFAGTNTDNQTLSFNVTSGVLGISGGNTVTITPVGTAGGVLNGTYPNPGLIDNAVTSNKILDAAVTTNKLNNLSVTTAKINDGAVTGAKIIDGAVTSAKLSSTGVTPGTYGTASVVPQINVDAQGRITSVSPINITGIAPGGAAGGELAGTYPNPTIATAAGNSIVTAVNNAATTGQIATGRLAGAVVLESESPVGGVISGNFSGGLQINDNAVTTAKINNGAVTSAKLATTGVSAATYGAATIVPQITVDAQGRITSASPVTISGVAPGGAAAGDLAGTYPSPTIAAAAGNNIVSAVNSATTTGVIAPGRLDASVVLSTEAPAASDIAGNFNAGLSINNSAVTTAKINDGAVTTVKIADGAITNAKIPNNEIATSKITPSATPGQVLTTVAGATVWSNLPSLAGGTVTSITAGTGLSGGTITDAGTISVASNGITSVLLQSDAASDANRAVTTNHIRDAAVNDAKLTTTTVNAGTYGSSTLIPRITVNAQGRVTSASTVAVSGGSTEGLGETVAADPDAKGGIAFNLTSVSISSTGTSGKGLGNFNVEGSHYVSFTPVDDGHKIAPEDYILIANPGKPATIDLPPAAENKGRVMIFRSLGTNLSEALTVRAADGLDGAGTSEPLYMDAAGGNIAYSITVFSTGGTWLTLTRAISRNKG